MSLARPAEHPLPTDVRGFSCAVAASGGVARVTLTGELDMLAATEFSAALSAAIHDSVLVIVDLSGLTFIDSSGLHAMLTAHADVRGSDCRLVLIPGPRQVQRLFEITGVEKRLEFVADSNGLGRQPAAKDDAIPVDVPGRNWIARPSALSGMNDGVPAVGGLPPSGAAVDGLRRANRRGLKSVPPLGAQPSQGRARQKSAGDVALLDLQPDLAGDVSPEQRLAVRNALIVPGIEVEQGTWDPTACIEDERIIGRVLGVQVLSGVLVREVLLGARPSAQIYGPGDLMNVHDDRGEQSLPVISTVSVFEPAVLAVLDDRLLIAAHRWPRVAGGVLAQAMRQLDHAAEHQAISQLARVEDRLLALFWHLADRWGRVRSDGIAIGLSLTHETVGHLVGARRPTVTLGLHKLRDEQLLSRDADGVWLLAPASLQRLTNHQPNSRTYGPRSAELA